MPSHYGTGGGSYDIHNQPHKYSKLKTTHSRITNTFSEGDDASEAYKKLLNTNVEKKSKEGNTYYGDVEVGIGGNYLNAALQTTASDWEGEALNGNLPTVEQNMDKMIDEYTADPQGWVNEKVETGLNLTNEDGGLDLSNFGVMSLDDDVEGGVSGGKKGVDSNQMSNRMTQISQILEFSGKQYRKNLYRELQTAAAEGKTINELKQGDNLKDLEGVDINDAIAAGKGTARGKRAGNLIRMAEAKAAGQDRQQILETFGLLEKGMNKGAGKIFNKGNTNEKLKEAVSQLTEGMSRDQKDKFSVDFLQMLDAAGVTDNPNFTRSNNRHGEEMFRELGLNETVVNQGKGKTPAKKRTQEWWANERKKQENKEIEGGVAAGPQDE